MKFIDEFGDFDVLDLKELEKIELPKSKNIVFRSTKTNTNLFYDCKHQWRMVLCYPSKKRLCLICNKVFGKI